MSKDIRPTHSVSIKPIPRPTLIRVANDSSLFRGWGITL